MKDLFFEWIIEPPFFFPFPDCNGKRGRRGGAGGSGCVGDDGDERGCDDERGRRGGAGGGGGDDERDEVLGGGVGGLCLNIFIKYLFAAFTTGLLLSINISKTIKK